MRIRTHSFWPLAFLIALLSTLIALYTPPPSTKTSITPDDHDDSFRVPFIRNIVRQSGEFLSLLTKMVSRHHDHDHHLQRQRKRQCDHTRLRSSLIYRYKVSLVLTVDSTGCANFSSVQKAIDSVPDSSSSKTLIVVYSGTYRSFFKTLLSSSNITH